MNKIYLDVRMKVAKILYKKEEKSRNSRKLVLRFVRITVISKSILWWGAV